MQKKRSSNTLGSSVIVVLGGGMYTDGTPGPATQLRAEAAAELAQSIPDATIICSGGRGIQASPTSTSEAATMAQIIWKAGIDHGRIRLESESVDTIGNAVLVACRYLVRQKRRRPIHIHIVTSPFHAARAALCFRSVLGGPDWPLQVHTCKPTADDAERAAQETDLTRTIDFFRPVTPGNFAQAAKRLLDIGKPFYRHLPLLAELAANA
jgi:uncharacterized SAM-binding protein YcdF (DUF218 family)